MYIHTLEEYIAGKYKFILSFKHARAALETAYSCIWQLVYVPQQWMHLFTPKRLRNLLQVDFPSSVTQIKASAFHQSQFDIYNAAVDFIFYLLHEGLRYIILPPGYCFFFSPKLQQLEYSSLFTLSSGVINNSSTLGFSFMSVFVFVFLVLNFNTNLREFFLFSLWSDVVESSSAASAKCEKPDGV